MDVRREGDPTEFRVTYTAVDDGLCGAERVVESYRLSGSGLCVTVRVPGASKLRLQVPLIETDGLNRSAIQVQAGSAEVRYCGSTYRVRVPGCEQPGVMEAWAAPNRNAVYRAAVFEVAGDSLEYRASLD